MIRTEIGTLECALDDPAAVRELGEELMASCVATAEHISTGDTLGKVIARGMNPRLVITIATEWDS